MAALAGVLRGGGAPLVQPKRRSRFSTWHSRSLLVEFPLFTGVRESILQLAADAWRPAIRQDGQEREAAQIAEITHIKLSDLIPWPNGLRVIIRRERQHPGAQLKFTDHEGHRFQATLTDLTGDAVDVERLDRGRTTLRNLIRGAEQTGLESSRSASSRLTRCGSSCP